jgi:hypothetical protein
MYYKNFSKKIKNNKKNKRTKIRKRRTRSMTGGESFKCDCARAMKVRDNLIKEHNMSKIAIELFDIEIEKARLRDDLEGPERNVIALGTKIAELEKEYQKNRVEVLDARYDTMDRAPNTEILENLLAAQYALDDLMIAAARAAKHKEIERTKYVTQRSPREEGTHQGGYR